MDFITECAEYFQDLQNRICASLEELDGSARFREDRWEREEGGGGRTRLMSGGSVFEKAGVNFSHVHGQLSEEFSRQIPGEGRDFSATGISLVLHPQNPMVPAVHANFRFLSKGAKQWFGGGADMTPYYPYREDVVHFHRIWKQVCDRHPAVADYPRFKKWCDEYFFLPHREETRGVGGIFFDYLEGDRAKIFAFVRDGGESFAEAYLPIARRRKSEPFTSAQRAFQEFRRGRYVEFNLLYDRGTIFGLRTGGRIESILMSLPPLVRWLYDFQPVAGSREEELGQFLKPQDWLAQEIGGAQEDVPPSAKQ
jgi:coproporphyrinogen III oxidase